MSTKVPGCKGCGKTAHGGTSRDLTVEQEGDRYEVRVNGAAIQSFRSVVAAAVFAKGHIGSTVHPVKP